MMEEMRAQLASLMESIKEQPTDFTDPEVCKYFLTGLCPHDLFENTVCLKAVGLRVEPGTPGLLVFSDGAALERVRKTCRWLLVLG